MSHFINMTLNIDLKKILTTFNTIKQELSENFQDHHSLTLKDAQNQLEMREVQLKTVLEISEKIIIQFDSIKNIQSSPKQLSEDPSYIALQQKYVSLLKLQEHSELLLAQYKSEVQSLKIENEKLTTNQEGGNLFTVEVYQSEIEDLKKDYTEKLSELQVKIQKLEGSSLNKKHVELQKKYSFMKEQVIGYKRKVMELEDLIIKNNEHKKNTEAKYNELVDMHKKMFGYIEGLEIKVRKFQDKHKQKRYCSSNTISRDNSLSFYSRATDESRSFTLSVTGPIAVFSVSKLVY